MLLHISIISSISLGFFLYIVLLISILLLLHILFISLISLGVLLNILALNFAVNIISKERLLKEKNVVSSNPFLYEIPSDESVDVDWEVDFDFAEFLYNKKIQR